MRKYVVIDTGAKACAVHAYYPRVLFLAWIPRHRVNLLAGILQRTVLSVVDAHAGFPVFSLRLLRSGDSNYMDMVPSSPPTLGGYSCRGGSATVDWSIVSGGGDGTVAHWLVVGLERRQERSGAAEHEGVVLHKIGAYEVMLFEFIVRFGFLHTFVECRRGVNEVHRRFVEFLRSLQRGMKQSTRAYQGEKCTTRKKRRTKYQSAPACCDNPLPPCLDQRNNKAINTTVISR